jgi:hypothetical protein
MQDPGTVYTAKDGRVLVFVVDKIKGVPLWVEV